MFDSPEGTVSILPPGSSLGNSLRHVNRLIQRDLGVRIAPLGISLGQWYALRTLWISDDLTQIELAQKSGVAGPAMVIAVRSLLLMGLVVRHRHPTDQRKYVISLTAKGRRLEQPALQAAIDTNAAATVNIDPADVEDLHARAAAGASEPAGQRQHDRAGQRSSTPSSPSGGHRRFVPQRFEIGLCQSPSPATATSSVRKWRTSGCRKTVERSMISIW